MSSVSEIHISGTDDDPAVMAQDRLVERGDELRAELAAKIAAATQLELAPTDRSATYDGLVRFCEDKLLRHCAVTDRVLYAVAAGAAETRLLVRGLRTQQQALAQYVDELRRAGHREQVTEAAHAAAAVLGTCLDVERTVLLPALAELPGVDLTGLVSDVSTLDGGGELEIPATVDVREIPHGKRHPRIFGVYARLSAGGSFVLVNNHDPKPLRREFAATFPHQFSWDYVESGPDVWRVRITRLPDAV